ncbi:MAG: hypothetical protein Q9191_000311 [Dirinaria sp. TL-2023a]
MDPLSFSASLIAVIGAARAGSRVGAEALQKLAAYRHAPQEIHTLRAELERFEQLLEQATNVVKDVDKSTLQSRGQILAQEVDKVGKKIEEINRLLFASKGFIAKLSDEKQAKVVWMQNKKNIKNVQADLKEVWNTLNCALGILTASTTQGMRQSVETCVMLGVANSERLAALAENMANIEELARYTAADRKVVHTSTNSDSLLAPRSRLENSRPQSEGAKSEFEWQVTPRNTQKCGSWCSCRCHSRTTFKMPVLLTNVLGHVTLEYTSNRTKCDEHSCRRSASSFNLSYNLPWYVATKYLSFSMMYTPLYGTRANLRMPRVMDWRHLLWMYANDGNIIAIQGLFSTSKATPHDVNQMGQTALYYATSHPKLYRFLIENRGDPNVADIYGNKPNELIGERLLCGELEEDDAYAISESLEETDFMETRQFTIIHKIVLGIVKRNLKDELEVSTALVNSTDNKGRTPLAWATLRKDLPTISTLLAFGADPDIADDNGDTPLHFVRSCEICSALLAAKPDVHVVNKTLRQVCLHTICKGVEDKPELIELLHDAGANIDARDADRETPLLNAIFKKHTGTVRKLIELGADVNAANYSSRESPILFAASFDHYEIIPMLLEHGADYHATTRYGRSIAHNAVINGGSQILMTLAAMDLTGLDLSLKDDTGRTAAQYMAEREFFPESEAETREAFEMLQQSILGREMIADEMPTTAAGAKSESEVQLPGTYPT